MRAWVRTAEGIWSLAYINEPAPIEGWGYAAKTTLTPPVNPWCPLTATTPHLSVTSYTFGPPPPKQLPQLIRDTLAVITRDRLANERPGFEHCVRLLDAIGQVISWHDAKLAKTVQWMLSPFNDLVRGVGHGHETMPTEMMNLKLDAVRALDQVVLLRYPKREWAGRIATVLQRRLGTQIRSHTVLDWRRELHRKTNDRGAVSTIRKRYAQPFPKEFGATPEARLRTLMVRLERDTETVAKQGV